MRWRKLRHPGGERGVSYPGIDFIPIPAGKSTNVLLDNPGQQLFTCDIPNPSSIKLKLVYNHPSPTHGRETYGSCLCQTKVWPRMDILFFLAYNTRASAFSKVNLPLEAAGRLFL